MTVYEFKDVKIDGNTYDLDVHDLRVHNWVRDFNDIYGYGDNACVITDIDFDLVVIHLYDDQIEIDNTNKAWQSIKKQVSERILDDYEFMQEWQNREFGE
jgi:hypothetical protein